ncbi:MAG: PQQ-dependent sugar dehydrogenase [Akkermansiaceae bacterium]|jgi:cytochrome c|nr:PQQ-dependent sugar dehydrogenase [Luteolibacter sp.]
MKPILLISFLFSVALYAEKPNPAHFKVEVLTEGFIDPQEMVMLPDGRILICQRTGNLRVWSPGSNQLTEGGSLKVAIKTGNTARECGFIGITADPEFAKNNWIYCYYSLPDISSHRLSRFTFKDGQLVPSSEHIYFEVPTERTDSTCHEGGSLAFGPNRMLYLSTGDNTNPFSKPATPIEEDVKERDAQRSSSNSNDLRGKVLRIQINPDGTHKIPEGNLFKPGTDKTRPEIYTMGLRNPYRISINPKTGTLYWSEVAPDKKPTGEEINQAKTAGYYGWPYVITDTKVFNNLAGQAFEPASLKNLSKNNTGITDLPVPRNPFHFYERSCSIIGEVYHATKDQHAFPAYYDNYLFFSDWNRSWFKAIKLDADEKNVAVEEFPMNFKFRKPIDMFFNKGVLYVLEYGNGWYDVKDGRLIRVSYDTSFNQITPPDGDPRLVGTNQKSKGVKLMQATTCLSCHTAQAKIVGPSFVDIVEKHGKDPLAVDNLFEKVRKGSVGVWGEQAMPAHILNTDDEVKEMIKAILATKKEQGHTK